MSMSPEERELLHRSVALAEENHDILRSIQRSMRLAHLMTVLYWLFIIGAAFGAYYVAQPYIQKAINVYTGTKTNLESVSTFINSFKTQPSTTTTR